MANTNIKAPKLNISNIKSPLSGSGSGLGRVGQGGTSKVGTLLIETNRILVEIQKQLAFDFAIKVSESKEENQRLKKEESKKKLKAEESALEKTGKKIGKAVGKVTSKILSPVKGIFDKVLDFIITLGAGIATNAAFEWIKSDENKQKLDNVFHYIKENWKWILGISAAAIAIGPILSVIATLTSIVSIIISAATFLIGLFGAPAFLTLMGILASAAGIYMIKKFISGGDKFMQYDQMFREEAKQSGIDPKNFGTGAVVLNDDGTQRYVNVYDIPEGDPQKLPGPSLMGRKAKPGQENRNLRVPLNLSNKLHRDYIRKVDGQEALDKYDAAEKLYRARMTKKDEIRDQLREQQDKITGRQGWDFMGAFADMYMNDEQRSQMDKLNESFNTKLDNAFSGMGRAMGGPVTAGQTYLVGEKGPEIFSPNINGSIVNNMRTEKIVQTLSSDMREGSINMIELPPITNQLPPPEIPVPSGPATEVPDVSSVNLADPYRQLTPMLYGITV